MSFTRGVRGAISVEEDSPGTILRATQELLMAILQANPDLQPRDLASVFFTMTDDLTAAYPALAARQLGWVEVPLLCAREIALPGGMPRVIRILLLWNTDLTQSEVQHVYLGRAMALRPDLVSIPPQVQDPPLASSKPFPHKTHQPDNLAGSA